MKNAARIIIGSIILFIFQACHNDKSKDQDAAKKERQSFVFIKNGLIDGLSEIKASGLAITNSNNHRVIDLAKMIITDHALSDSVFLKMKAERKVSVTDTIDGYEKRAIDTLSKKMGPAFDRGYLSMMAAIHKRDTVLFAWAAKNTDAEISKFAIKTLSTLKLHLDSINAISSSSR